MRENKYAQFSQVETRDEEDGELRQPSPELAQQLLQQRAEFAAKQTLLDQHYNRHWGKSS